MSLPSVRESIMFFKNQQIPDELILNVLNRLPLKDAISFLRVSKEMSAFVKDKTIWKKFGAIDFEDFAKRTKPLPPAYQKAILAEQYTLPQVEQIIYELRELIQAHSNKNDNERTDELDSCYIQLNEVPQVAALFQKFPALVVQDRDILEQYIRVFNGLIDGIVTPDQLTEFNNQLYLYHLMSDNGKKALTEKLITLQEAKTLSPAMLGSLFKPNGMLILREKLMTIADIQNLILNTKLETALSGSLVKTSIEHRDITSNDEIKTVAKFAHATFALMHLTSDNGVVALKNKLLSPEDATQMSAEELEKLIERKASEFQAKPSSSPNPSKNA
jgi:hypothetical protein